MCISEISILEHYILSKSVQCDIVSQRGKAQWPPILYPYTGEETLLDFMSEENLEKDLNISKLNSV